jgi:hypothetical protein
MSSFEQIVIFTTLILFSFYLGFVILLEKFSHNISFPARWNSKKLE